MGLGYSVVNGVNVYPGIRYTGRLAGDPLGTMGSVGEGVIVNGTGVQRTTNSRWGDYTSMNVDPVDDCTFWYVNEYYTARRSGSARRPAGRRGSAPSSCPAAARRQARDRHSVAGAGIARAALSRSRRPDRLVSAA